jgi:hypothetical protein
MKMGRRKDNDIEWVSITSYSGKPGDEGVIKYVGYDQNPPIFFGPTTSVKQLEVRIESTQCEDEALLHHLLQKVK